jgi:ABC-type multidrug transport system fused ATPase/permease subunit
MKDRANDAISADDDAIGGAGSPTSTAWRLLKEALPPRWKLYALSILFMVGAAAATGALAWSTKLIVNDVFVAENTSAAVKVAGLVVFVSLMKSLFQYGNSVVQAMFIRSVGADYQKRIFRSLMGKDIWHFDRQHASGQMMQVKVLGQASGKTVVNLASKLPADLLTLIALFGVMLFQDPIMTLASCVLLPLIFLLVSRLSKKIREIANAETELTGLYVAIGTEAISGIKTVKSYRLEEKSIGRFEEAIAALEDRLLKIARITSSTVPIMEFLGGLVIGLFVIYAAWQTITFGKTPGEFTAFITAFLLAYQPAERVSHIWVDTQKSIIQVERMYALLDAPPRRPDGGTRRLDGVPPSVRFENVSFRYGPRSPALKDVSFEIAPGERVAIVGKSGAGKSTLIDLVLRFFDPARGTVSIGGVPLTEVSEDSLRDTVALISQDVFLFDGSILDNIRDGNPAATEEEALEAARLAALDDLIGPDGSGIHKNVGPNGASVSGGQRQRIGIARALAKKARIYVFDEATSALDVENERKIMENLSRMEDVTILFVTHRFSTITYVDRVIMLRDGSIVFQGAPNESGGTSAELRSLFGLSETDDIDDLTR